MTGPVTRLRVLVANRGEIAIRIIRAADAVGIESVAVHPAVDEGSLHTQLATDVAPDRRARRRRGRLPRQCRPRRRGRCRAGATASTRATASWPRAPTSPPPARPPASRSSARARRRWRCSATRCGARELAESLGIPIVPGAGAVATRRRGGEGGERGRLPRAAQGGCRRRWAGHARRGRSGRRRHRVRARQQRGRGGVRRRDGLRRAPVERPRHIEVQILADEPRPRRPPPRPRLLGAAAPPEGRRDRPGARARRRRCASGWSTSAVRLARGRRVRQRRHRRVPRPARDAASSSSSSATRGSRSSTPSPSR